MHSSYWLLSTPSSGFFFFLPFKLKAFPLLVWGSLYPSHLSTLWKLSSCRACSLYFSLLKGSWQFCFIHLGLMFASANFCGSGTLLYKQHVKHSHCHLVHSVTAILASTACINFVILTIVHFRIPYVFGPGFSQNYDFMYTCWVSETYELRSHLSSCCSFVWYHAG